MSEPAPKSKPKSKPKTKPFENAFYAILTICLLLVVYIPYFVLVFPKFVIHHKKWPLFAQILVLVPVAFLLGVLVFGTYYFVKYRKIKRRAQQAAQEGDNSEENKKGTGASVGVDPSGHVMQPQRVADSGRKSYEMTVLWDAEEMMLEDVELGSPPKMPKAYI